MASFSELCQENKLQGWPTNQKRKGQTLVDRSQVFSDKLDEMIQQLTAMEASMEEEEKAKTPSSRRKDGRVPSQRKGSGITIRSKIK
ncbi:hypothetical protein HOLleu_33459 [Holothuria leucospilota]|uniref:Uncharacterized protein n=1 Tax=Holothuria leucospilota TaxID=206669 RepID=A0A9Q1BH86_HOLLE|nr:hypothetical protein HOLleu_33459 [Holothuria leucospilota]